MTGALILAAAVAAAPLDTPWKRHTIDASSRGADGVRLADLDGDGLLDVVTGWEEGGVIRVCLNPGPKGARGPWPGVTVGRVASPEDAVMVDLDGDGRLDVVSSCEGRTQGMFVHWGPKDRDKLLDPGAWRTEPIPAAQDKTRWMFALPVPTRAGKGFDLVVGSKQPGAMIGWLHSPEDPRRLDRWRLRAVCQAGWIMSLVAADLDGDGDPDVVASDRKGPGRRVLWLENPGPGRGAAAWKAHTLGAAGEEVMFLDVADVEGDGRRDVLVAVKPRAIVWLRQPAEKDGDWTGQRIDYGDRFGTAKAVRAGDVDGDGRTDLVVTCEGAKGPLSGIFWLQRKGAGPEAPWTARDIGGPEGAKYDLVELLDLDGDGDLDALTCEERDNLGVVWYENGGEWGRSKDE